MRTYRTLRCQPCLKVAREHECVGSRARRCNFTRILGDAFGSAVTAGERTHGSAIAAAYCMKSGVRRSIAGTSCAVKSAVHGGDRAPEGARSFPKPKLT